MPQNQYMRNKIIQKTKGKDLDVPHLKVIVMPSTWREKISLFGLMELFAN